MLPITFIGNSKSRVVSVWQLFKDALMLLTWMLFSSDNSKWRRAPEADLECGNWSRKKRNGPVLRIPFGYIFRQIFLFTNGNCGATPTHSTAVPLQYINQSSKPESGVANSFVDLSAVKARHRVESISRGQKYVSPPSPPTTKSKAQMTGDQLSNYIYPPEPLGENFRKWILVMATLFPNRATYLRNLNMD
ncbi:hypothetical protein BDZ97DRAFT_1789502, partial [Flammula alnicola]